MTTHTRVWAGSPGECDHGLLDDAEGERAGRFRQAADRNRFMTGRVLAKTLVAELANVDPHDVRIAMRCLHCGFTDHGKPRAIHPKGSHPVSVSHAANLVLVAATTGGPDCGVDVEVVRPGLDHVALGRHIESPAERGTVRDAAGFYRLWTAKEAILKCSGTGLMGAMSDLTLRRSGMTLYGSQEGERCFAAVAVATEAPLEFEFVDVRGPSFGVRDRADGLAAGWHQFEPGPWSPDSAPSTAR